MDIFKKLKIKTKLLLLLVVPLLGIAYFATTLIQEKLAYTQHIGKIQELSHFSALSSALVHELQKERGASAGFLGSEGKRFGSELVAQRQSTDRKLEVFQIHMKDFDLSTFRAPFRQYVTAAQRSLQRLMEIRQSVLAQRIPVREALTYYTQQNASLLDAITQVALESHDVELSNELVAYSGFLKAKERAGIERAVLSSVFAKGHFEGEMFQRFTSIIAQQVAFLEVFKSYASKEELIFYEKIMNHPVVAQVEKYRQIALGGETNSKVFSGFAISMGYGGFIHQFKNYVLRRDSKYLIRAKQLHEEIVININEIQRLENLSTQNQKDLATLKATLDRYVGFFDTLESMVAEKSSIISIDRVVRVDDGPALAALNRLVTGDLGVDPLVWFNKITKKINLLKQVEDKLTADLNQAASRLKSGVNVIVIITIFIVLLTLLISSLINFSINNMLKRLIFDVNRAAEQQAVASEQIASGSMLQSEGSAKQAASLEETSAALEEISAQTRENASAADQTLEMMRSAHERIQTTAQNSDRAAEFSKKVSNSSQLGVESMTKITEVMLEINESNDRVNDVIEVLNEITHQTKMLATNAAIEAARAGEVGKGFAVVADEVSKLAENSKSSAKEVTHLIRVSVEKARIGTDLAHQGERVLQDILEQSLESSELMSEIMFASKEQVEGIQQVQNQVEMIKVSSGDQAVGVEQVSKAMVEIDQVTQINASNAEENAAAAEELSAQSYELKSLIKEVAIQIGLKGDQLDMQDALQMKKQYSQPPAPARTSLKGMVELSSPERGGRRIQPSDKIPMRDDFKDF